MSVRTTDGMRADRAVKLNLTCNDLSKPHVRAAIWDKSEGRCWYCGRPMHPFRDFSIDHMVPISRGGQHTYDNLVPCCEPCNRKKGPRPVEEFRRLMTRPSFSSLQRQFLQSIEANLDAVPAYRFWFEREGDER